jgi:hypothetical protein
MTVFKRKKKLSSITKWMCTDMVAIGLVLGSADLIHNNTPHRAWYKGAYSNVGLLVNSVH